MQHQEREAEIVEVQREGGGGGVFLNAANTHLSLIKFTTHRMKTPRLQTAIHLHVCLPVIVHLCTASAHQLTCTALPLHPSIPCRSATMSASASRQHLFSACVHFFCCFSSSVKL